MVGRKKKRVPPWSSVARLRKLSEPSSSARIRARCCSKNGVRIEMPRLSTRKGIPGTVWSIRESICSKSSPRTIVFTFPGRRRICRSRWFDRFRVNNEFVSYIDALGELDGTPCVIDWKTTTSRYPEEPEGLLSLDPQLICYSWISGIPEVAVVVFVRKNQPEIQYLRATISEEQRREYGRLVETTIAQIEAGQFVSHSGIRFPQNGCVSCPHLGLCLNNQPLIDANLIRRPGASDLDWLNDLDE